MRATGIVRRIDELGRIVIPKEIRRTLRIREGDPLEIYTNSEGAILLKKYSPIGDITGFARQYAQSIAQITGSYVVITDRDQIVAIAGGVKKEYLGKRVSKELEEIMKNRVSVNSQKKDKEIEIVEGEQTLGFQQIIHPILCDSEIIGSIMLATKDSENSITEVENKIASVAAVFLGRQLEA